MSNPFNLMARTSALLDLQPNQILEEFPFPRLDAQNGVELARTHRDHLPRRILDQIDPARRPPDFEDKASHFGIFVGVCASQVKYLSVGPGVVHCLKQGAQHIIQVDVFASRAPDALYGLTGQCLVDHLPKVAEAPSAKDAVQAENRRCQSSSLIDETQSLAGQLGDGVDRPADGAALRVARILLRDPRRTRGTVNQCGAGKQEMLYACPQGRLQEVERTEEVVLDLAPFVAWAKVPSQVIDNVNILHSPSDSSWIGDATLHSIVTCGNKTPVAH